MRQREASSLAEDVNFLGLAVNTRQHTRLKKILKRLAKPATDTNDESDDEAVTKLKNQIYNVLERNGSGTQVLDSESGGVYS